MAKNKDHINNAEISKPNQPDLLEKSENPSGKSKKSRPMKNDPVAAQQSNNSDSVGKEATDSWNRFAAKCIGKTVFLFDES